MMIAYLKHSNLSLSSSTAKKVAVKIGSMCPSDCPSFFFSFQMSLKVFKCLQKTFDFNLKPTKFSLKHHLEKYVSTS